MAKNNKKTDFYWQVKVNGKRNYVAGLDWLIERVEEVRFLEIYPLNPPEQVTKLLVYLERGVFYHAKFDNYEDAKTFIVQTIFNHSNKEIHST